MKNAIIDTDVLSYFFRDVKEVVIYLEKYLIKFGQLNISIISYYEVLSGLYFKDANKQLNLFRKFANENNIITLNKEIVDISAKVFSNLRSRGLSIGHNDCLIAGTAIYLNMPLVTNNISHFNRIQNLEINHWSIN